MRTAFSLNFDSLGVKTFKLADRFMVLADKLGLRYTIFVCGKDLEDRYARDRVKEWSKAGHEIANHAYSHRLDFGSMHGTETYFEVRKTHDVISEICGKEPVGFTSPQWTPPRDLVGVLRELNYKYDASIMPSPFLYLAHLKMKAKWGMEVDKTLRHSLTPRTPYFNGMWELPLPTTRILRIPVWHTMAYITNIQRLLKSCFSERFYYLMHPADLMDSKDFPDARIERIDIPVKDKTELLKYAMMCILEHSDEVVTMEGLCE